ncbi:hypothetical protein DPMN_041407 [Dreissena polymorpha]|uniref:Uncharacterized protein n=1 Tax=Dreissena polymorpha TaxID=45954 RepID=A0A9D4HW01_DREPO|nr:hypothetical protein DPMN_041407 [Dreissena polymorpha]
MRDLGSAGRRLDEDIGAVISLSASSSAHLGQGGSAVRNLISGVFGADEEEYGSDSKGCVALFHQRTKSSH